MQLTPFSLWTNIEQLASIAATPLGLGVVAEQSCLPPPAARPQGLQLRSSAVTFIDAGRFELHREEAHTCLAT